MTIRTSLDFVVGNEKHEHGEVAYIALLLFQDIVNMDSTDVVITLSTVMCRCIRTWPPALQADVASWISHGNIC